MPQAFLGAMIVIEVRCSYQHRAWKAPCGRPETDALHYGPNGELRPPYAEYTGPVRHPFNASARWDVWLGEPEEELE